MRDFHHNQNQQVHPDIINYDPPHDNLHSDTSSMISEDDYHDDSLPCLTISGNGESLMSNASSICSLDINHLCNNHICSFRHTFKVKEIKVIKVTFCWGEVRGGGQVLG